MKKKTQIQNFLWIAAVGLIACSFFLFIFLEVPVEVANIALLAIIASIGATWTIFQFRIGSDVSLNIKINEPEINFIESSKIYNAIISVDIVNSGRNVELLFVDENGSYLKGIDANKDLNNLIKKSKDGRSYEPIKDKKISGFMVSKVNYNGTKFLPDELLPFYKIKESISAPREFIRKGASYNYSALIMLNEPGWYCFQFYLVVDYNKETTALHRQHPNRYVTWTPKKYVYVGDHIRN